MTPPSPSHDLSTRELWMLPNQLTLLRFVLAVVLMGMIGAECWVGCLVTFALAALTDWLDGLLARRYGLGSALGRNLDPLADKVLICGAFIFLLPLGNKEGEGWLLPWMVTVVVLRELIITAVRSLMEGQGIQFGADWLGKLKMNLQCAALVVIFVALEAFQDKWASIWIFDSLRSGLIYAMVAATALSGLQYLWKAAVLLRPTAKL